MGIRWKITGTVLLMLILMLAGSLQAQGLLRGTVRNAQGQPLAAASVFLASTSYGTVTNESGSFALALPTRSGTYNLTVSYTGYSTYQLSVTLPQAAQQPLAITLQPRPGELDDVVVRPFVKGDWVTWGRLFTDLFLGTMPEAAQCRIENPRAIEFRHFKGSNMLQATARQPIIITNKALGYRVQYLLEDFSFDFKEKYLNYVGYALFTPLSSKSKKMQERWQQARENTYHGSQMHFMRALYHNRLEADGFEVRRLVRVPNQAKDSLRQALRALMLSPQGNGAPQPGQQRLSLNFADSSNPAARLANMPDHILTLYTPLLPWDSIATRHNETQVTLGFDNLLHITYLQGKVPQAYLDQQEDAQVHNGKPISWLELLKDKTVVVEASGNYFHPTDIYAHQYWGWRERMATMLPMDYEPQAKKTTLPAQ